MSDLYLEVCNKSLDKILLTDGNISKATYLEIHNTDSFVYPDHNAKLKHIPWSVQIRQGQVYDIKKLFGPYLRYSKIITIFDPYILNKKARRNLKIILSTIKAPARIVFRDFRKNKKHALQELEQFIEGLKKRYRFLTFEVEVINADQKHIERYLKTEEVLIQIPGGFDFLNEDGTAPCVEESVNEANTFSVEEISNG